MEHELLTVRSVKDIPASDKRCLEGLLGRPLQEDQQIFIIAFTAGVVPDEATRRKALAGIHQIQAKAAAYADAHGVTETEIDAAVDEATEQVRRRAP